MTVRLVALLACVTSTLAATRAPLMLKRVAIAVREPLTTVRWNLDLIRQRRAPLRVGVDLEVRENDKGRGLYAMRTLAEGTLIGRYTGKIIPGEVWEDIGSEGYCACWPREKAYRPMLPLALTSSPVRSLRAQTPWRWPTATSLTARMRSAAASRAISTTACAGPTAWRAMRGNRRLRWRPCTSRRAGKSNRTRSCSLTVRAPHAHCAPARLP